MQRELPADIEAALAGYLGAKGMTASAPPLSPNYTARLPFFLVTRTGGAMRTRVLTENQVEVDAYAPTWEAAQAAAANALAWIARAPAEGFEWGTPAKKCPVYTATTGLPYNNPDPLHPNTPRVTFSATVTTRAFVETT